MHYIWQHIAFIIETYTGEIPLAPFLKNYFKQHSKLGSRDRRLLSAMAYSWYRCSKSLPAKLDLEQKVILCLSLCNQEVPGIFAERLQAVKEDIQPVLDNLISDKITFSGGIEKEEWLNSLLAQPQLFIRIRKDNGKVISLLNNQSVPIKFITDTCLSLPNGCKVDSILPEDTYVVQDASSQATGEWFQPKKNDQWYDCCCGAGGKSILLKDLQPGLRLTVTDARDSIIRNLQQRFKTYRMVMPVVHVVDVTNPGLLMKAIGAKQFDNIICDAPCSGSGTWARTPEQNYYFKASAIEQFASRQKAIAINVSRHVKPGGYLFYITCSVFRAENEAVVEEVVKATGMVLVNSELINGIGIKADSMFIAKLQRPELVN